VLYESTGGKPQGTVNQSVSDSQGVGVQSQRSNSEIEAIAGALAGLPSADRAAVARHIETLAQLTTAQREAVLSVCRTMSAGHEPAESETR